MDKKDILSHSQRLFTQYGYQKTKLTDIARSLGKVKTALYYYFSGKEEIFSALVREESESFYQELMSLCNAEEAGYCRLKAYFTHRIHLMSKLATKYAFLRTEILDLYALIDENREITDKKEKEFIKNQILKGKEKGQFMLDDAAVKAEIVFITLKSLEVQLFVKESFIISDVNIASLTDYLIEGLKTN